MKKEELKTEPVKKKKKRGRTEGRISEKKRRRIIIEDQTSEKKKEKKKGQTQRRKEKKKSKVKSYGCKSFYVCLITKISLNYELWKLSHRVQTNALS